ncbi:FecR domain-containing protein [Calycomorphotria hydatis]|uniref:FecR protein n=1 Tax=Calycomorphotria hydatis TaxID=2528027 RepID=A0A517TDD9_9PLAN|nr:FecR family protein [Calycomorphotria hydatis]QDT66381.1 FecR protein [Calycomorphotria hydatis]
MSKPADPFAEIRTLAKAACDGSIAPRETERLGELLSADLQICQWYLDYMDVHAHLTVFGAMPPTEDLAEQLLGPKRRKRDTWRKQIAAVTASVLSVALMVAIGLAISLLQPPPPTAGKIIGLTSDAEWLGSDYLPGALVLDRTSLTLKSGIATLRLTDGVIVNIQGPSTIEATSKDETKLIEGSLHAIVPEQAIGYTVRTPDAEIVDLGTEFSVDRSSEFGTRVVVRHGTVEGRPLTTEDEPARVFQLSAGRAMEFPPGTGLARTLTLLPDWERQFEIFDNAHGGIAQMDGVLRTSPSVPADLRPGQMPTNDYIMLVRECAGIILQEDLQIQQVDGPVTLPAGTMVDSYLLHFDPQIGSTASPLGTVSFTQPIVAVAVSSDDLMKTDQLCSVEGSLHTQETYRGLELDLDTASLSPDRKTLTIHFGRSGDIELDQCRVLVRHVEPTVEEPTTP